MAISTIQPKWNFRSVDPRNILRDGRFQCRVTLDQSRVASYAYSMRGGADFPKIDVASIGGKLYVIDGFHRLEAALSIGLRSVPIRLARMSEQQARALALQANWTHGLSLNRADKQNIFARYVEGSFHLLPGGGVKSYRAIRQDLHGLVSPATIGKWLKAAGVTPSDDDERDKWSTNDSDDNEEVEISEQDQRYLESAREQLTALRSGYDTLDGPDARLAFLSEVKALLALLETDGPAGNSLEI